MSTLADWRALTDPSPHGIKRAHVSLATVALSFGAGALLTVPGDQLMRVVAVRFQLATSVNVSNRVVALLFSLGGTQLYTVAQTLTQTASQTAVYTFMLGYNVVASGGATPNIAVTAPLPDLILQPGYAVNVQVVGVSGADAVTAAELLVEQVDTLSVGAPALDVTFGDDLAELEHAVERHGF
jgi:hypothetical protein